MSSAITVESDSDKGKAKSNSAASLFGQLIAEASLAYSQGDMTKSLELYDRLIELDPENNVLAANKSAILLKIGRFEEATCEAEKAIKLKPSWAKVVIFCDACLYPYFKL